MTNAQTKRALPSSFALAYGFFSVFCFGPNVLVPQTNLGRD
jgi:hypothetical protein